MRLNKGDKAVCPHCYYEYDEPIEDFVIAGYTGVDSISDEPNQCPDCDELFSVEHIGENKYEISEH